MCLCVCICVCVLKGIMRLSAGVQCRQLQKAQVANQVPLQRDAHAYQYSAGPQLQGDLLLPCNPHECEHFILVWHPLLCGLYAQAEL